MRGGRQMYRKQRACSRCSDVPYLYGLCQGHFLSLPSELRKKVRRMNPAQRQVMIDRALDGQKVERPAHWEYEPTEQQVAELIERFGEPQDRKDLGLPSADDSDAVVSEQQAQVATAGKSL